MDLPKNMPKISFSNHVEIHDITQHSRSLWDDLFYEDKEIAEFRHTAFLIECGLLQEDDDDDSHKDGSNVNLGDHHETIEDNLSNNNNHDMRSEADTIKSLDDWNASGSVATCSPGASQRSTVSPSRYLHNSLPVLQVEFTRAEQLTKAKKKKQQQQQQQQEQEQEKEQQQQMGKQQHQTSTSTVGTSHSSMMNDSKSKSDATMSLHDWNALGPVGNGSAGTTPRSPAPATKDLHNSLPTLQVEFTPGEQMDSGKNSKSLPQHQPSPQNATMSTTTSGHIPTLAVTTDIRASDPTTSTPSISRRSIRSVISRPIRSPSKKVKSTSSHKMMVPKIQASDKIATSEVGTATVATAINNNSTSSHNSSMRSKSFQVLIQRSKNQKQQLQQQKHHQQQQEAANETTDKISTSLLQKQQKTNDDPKTGDKAMPVEMSASTTSFQSRPPATLATPSRGRGSLPSSPRTIPSKHTASLNDVKMSSPSIRDKINLWKKRDETSTQNMGRSCSPHVASPSRLLAGNRDFDNRRTRSLTPVRSMAVRATIGTPAPSTPITTTFRPTTKHVQSLKHNKEDLPLAIPLPRSSTATSPLRSTAVEARQQERLQLARSSTTSATTMLTTMMSPRHSTGSNLAAPRTPIPTTPRSHLPHLSNVASSPKLSSEIGTNLSTSANKVKGVEPSPSSMNEALSISTTQRHTDDVPPPPPLHASNASMLSPIRPPRTPRRFLDASTAASSVNKSSNDEDCTTTRAWDQRDGCDDSDDEEALQRFLDRVRSGKPASTTTTGLGLSSPTQSSPNHKQRSFSPSAIRIATGLLATTTPSRRHYKSASWAANTSSSLSSTPASSRVVESSAINKNRAANYTARSSSDSSSDSSDEEVQLSPAATFLLKRSGRRLSIASAAGNGTTSPTPSTFKSPLKRSPLKRSPLPKSSLLPKPGSIPSDETNISPSPKNGDESKQKKNTLSKSKRKSKSSPSLLTVDSTLISSNNKTPRSRSSSKPRTKSQERRSSPIVVDLVPPPPL